MNDSVNSLAVAIFIAHIGNKADTYRLGEGKDPRLNLTGERQKELLKKIVQVSFAAAEVFLEEKDKHINEL